ncbi:putative transcriptional regulatory protein [Fusarium oxysporum f. sp. albedinis]|nr:putative transcriptional regulatory protein [Fusarium oxysporum f. sp. albedinis]
MAYPPAKIQTQRLIKRLRPVLTCQLNGEPGKNANASFIISRVIWYDLLSHTTYLRYPMYRIFLCFILS